MAKLTAKKRNALPDSAFAIPSKRKYPINDKSHAIRAKGRAAQMAHQGGKGHISAATEKTIDRKANKVLHHKGGRAHAGGHHPKEHHGGHENAHILPMAGSKATQHSHPGHNPGMGHNPGLAHGHPSHDGKKGYGDGFGHGGMHGGKTTHHNIRHRDHHQKMREG